MSGADRGTTPRGEARRAIRRYRKRQNPGYLKVMRADVQRLRTRSARRDGARPLGPTGVR
jgi:hypothetical protein